MYPEAAAPFANVTMKVFANGYSRQIHIDSEINGKKPPDLAERMKNMSPETRKRAEAAMKQQGVAAGDSGSRRVCYGREMVEQGRLAGQPDGCKTDYSTRTPQFVEVAFQLPKDGVRGRRRSHFSRFRELGRQVVRGYYQERKTKTTRSTITANGYLPIVAI
jgi:hypothetical protein